MAAILYLFLHFYIYAVLMIMQSVLIIASISGRKLKFPVLSTLYKPLLHLRC